MENILYTLNLAIHIIAAAFCVSAPLYQLRWVKLRRKLGRPIVFPFDKVMENVLGLQPKLCIAFITTLILTGFAFPLIHYGFHGQWAEYSDISMLTFHTKTLLTFLGLSIVLYSAIVIDPQTQRTFASFFPNKHPPDELLNHFWELRAKRAFFCNVCFVLALIIMAITPVLRFYK